MVEQEVGIPEAAPAPESAPAPEVTESTPTPDVVASSDSPLAGGPYVPNTKISVMDKEFEIPAQFHGLMKDKETEKAVREIFEKAEGLPIVKQRLQEQKQQFDTMGAEHQRLKTGIESLRNTYKQAAQTQNWLKMDDFFQKLDIPKEHIFAYAVAHARLMEMNPEQRQAVEQSLEADRRAETFASQQASTQSMYAQQARQMKQMEVEITFASPEVGSVSQDFDTRIGKPGAFKDLVMREGELEWIRSNGQNNLPVRQAVERVMQNYGIKPGAPGAAAMAPATSSVPGKAVVQRTDRTIPNIAGRPGSSPLKSKPKSVEDLKKLYASMAASEG